MATRTAVAAGGTWTVNGTWLEGTAPTAADDVVLSGLTGTLTLAGTTNVCRSLDATGCVGTMVMGSGVLLTIGDATAGAGNVALKLVAGMTFTPNAGSLITFASSSATLQTITSAGKTLGIVTWNNASGNWAVTTNMTTAGALQFIAGTVHMDGAADTSGLTHSFANVTCPATATRNVNWGLSSTTWTGSGTTIVAMSATGLTITASSATFTLTGSTSSWFVNSATTIGTLNINSSGTVTIQPGVFTNFVVNGTGVNSEVVLAGSITTTTTCTLNGAVAARLLLRTSVVGIPATITNTGCTMAGSYVDFRDITLSTAWNASAITGGSGNALGNTNITFTTNQTNYRIGNSGNWSDATKWASSSGGSGGTGRMPLPQDHVAADANTFSGTGFTITLDVPRLGCNIDFSAVGTDNPALSLGATQYYVYGNWTLCSGMTATGSTASYISGLGRGSHTFTSRGVTYPGSVSFAPFGGTYTLGDDLIVTTGWVTGIQAGVATSFISAGYTITCKGSQHASSAGVDITNSTINITGDQLSFGGQVWAIPTSATFVSTGSTINFTAFASSSFVFFEGGNKTYNIVNFAGYHTSGSTTVNGSNTFAQLNFTTTVADLTPVAIPGSNTFGRPIQVASPRIFTITAGTTQTFLTGGSLGNGTNLVTSQSSTAATTKTTYTLVCVTGRMDLDYVALNQCVALGEWYVGPNSPKAVLPVSSSGLVYRSYNQNTPAVIDPSKYQGPTLISSSFVLANGVPGTTPAFSSIGASLLVLCYTGNSSAPTFTDNAGNTWTALTQQGSSSFTRFYYVVNPQTKFSHTVTSSTINGASFVVAAFANVSGFDVESAGAASASATSLQPGSATPAQTASLVLLGGGGVGAGAHSANLGFVPIMTYPFLTSVNVAMYFGYRIADAAAINPTISQSGAAAAIQAISAVFTPVRPAILGGPASNTSRVTRSVPTVLL